ncbi:MULTISPECIES: hypothetical protein [Clostridia]|uniref:hypothetical protein n=1 Tax=Clostridia TaxID=186801 RepID=UPI0011C46701|nr:MULTISPECIES: hypothetical protein [Clostridia]
MRKRKNLIPFNNISQREKYGIAGTGRNTNKRSSQTPRISKNSSSHFPKGIYMSRPYIRRKTQAHGFIHKE